MIRLFLAALVLQVTVAGGFFAAAAHEGRPIHIEVAPLFADRYQVRWKIPPVLRSGEVPSIDLLGDCTPETDQAAGLVGRMLVRCSFVPEAVALVFPSYNPALSILVDYRLSDGERHTVFVGPEVRTINLPGEQTVAGVAWQYLVAGFDHILEGFDHLLFVFCLLLVVGRFRRIIWAVTGFTLGHSVTLGLTAIYDLSLPPTFVEPLIALSIAMLAAEKLVADQEPEDKKTVGI